MAQPAHRVVLELVLPDGVKAMQKKINQWISNDILIKYEATPCGSSVFFNILLRKTPKA